MCMGVCVLPYSEVHLGSVELYSFFFAIFLAALTAVFSR